MTTESKTYLLLIVPVLALFLLILTNLNPLYAQIGVPAGSYKNSCKDIQVMPGSVLWAQCEKTDGKFEKSTLQFARCEGDISNNKGDCHANKSPANSLLAGVIRTHARILKLTGKS